MAWSLVRTVCVRVPRLSYPELFFICKASDRPYPSRKQKKLPITARTLFDLPISTVVGHFLTVQWFAVSFHSDQIAISSPIFRTDTKPREEIKVAKIFFLFNFKLKRGFNLSNPLQNFNSHWGLSLTAVSLKESVPITRWALGRSPGCLSWLWTYSSQPAGT